MLLFRGAGQGCPQCRQAVNANGGSIPLFLSTVEGADDSINNDVEMVQLKEEVDELKEKLADAEQLCQMHMSVIITERLTIADK